MNKSAFLTLIKQVSDISDQQQSELEQVAATFPYCQTAHLLLAKSAYDRGSMLSTQRLRRASAYATDRQLLKRLIYTSPVPEPAYAEAGVIESEEDSPIPDESQEATTIGTIGELAAAKPRVHLQDEALPAASIEEVHPSDITEATIKEESLLPVAISEELETLAELETGAGDETETLEQVYSHTSAENAACTEQESEAANEREIPDSEIDSELALLFTFSSISSSSTDLLSQREIETDFAEQEEAGHDTAHLAQTAAVLHDLEEAQETDSAGLTEGTLPDAATAEAMPEVTTAVPAIPADAASETDEIKPASEPETRKSAAEDAEINYSFDEIDRLYAEDALGYWMGSSRMGEVLQLKDDYTRPRPQSFHPELILEYSRTHELEKAIQPTQHVLSKQLDIIDQFLKLNPRLKTMASLKLKPEPQEDLSLKSSKIKKGMASESLANIFIQQGKPKKAVKIYEQLILKYPEKKSYFAEQIEKLQNIT